VKKTASKSRAKTRPKSKPSTKKPMRKTAKPKAKAARRVAKAKPKMTAQAGPSARAKFAYKPVDPQTMMEQWMKLAAPGQPHARFKKLQGRWNATVRFWMDPTAPAQESTGEAEFTLFHGGRFMRQDYKSTSPQMPFEGLGLTGFDNFRKEYVDIWTDSMSTAFTISRGREESSTGAVNFKALADRPTVGQKDVPMRSITRFDGDDTHVIEMFSPGPSGKEFRNMEIVYKRVKS